jgi:hypothetical protein
MVQVWEPNGYTNTIQTTTGYDNRTSLGLNGTISMVFPRLVHTYLKFPSSIAPKPILMSWSAARVMKIDFHFSPEPGLLVQLMSGLLGLAVLDKRRRSTSR